MVFLMVVIIFVVVIELNNFLELVEVFIGSVIGLSVLIVVLILLVCFRLCMFLVLWVWWILLVCFWVLCEVMIVRLCGSRKLWLYLFLILIVLLMDLR